VCFKRGSRKSRRIGSDTEERDAGPSPARRDGGKEKLFEKDHKRCNRTSERRQGREKNMKDPSYEISV